MAALDHEFGDFWDGMDRGYADGSYYVPSRDYTPHTYDPLYYHRRHKFLGIQHETARAYLFIVTPTKGAWIPKSVCRKLKVKKKSKKVRVWIHQSITPKLINLI